MDLIEGQVFQKEDLAIAERIQSVIRSGANASFTLGKLEYPIARFHRVLDHIVFEGARD